MKEDPYVVSAVFVLIVRRFVKTVTTAANAPIYVKTVDSAEKIARYFVRILTTVITVQPCAKIAVCVTIAKHSVKTVTIAATAL